MHQDAREAIAALSRLLVNESLLQRMQHTALRDSLNRHDLLKAAAVFLLVFLSAFPAVIPLAVIGIGDLVGSPDRALAVR